MLGRGTEMEDAGSDFSIACSYWIDRLVFPGPAAGNEGRGGGKRIHRPVKTPIPTKTAERKRGIYGGFQASIELTIIIN